ncbi:Leucine-rich_repeat domain superfamily [Hexamita inflata]|uniref:Leucine-rich repeat domain superfamily n=1 Tax=Hexamita inflata TaxID=28002 RepID=A0AA86QJ14_9EUKA|nr:Leucine-rich repeat domain superfamily [Hexamita inflata]
MPTQNIYDCAMTVYYMNKVIDGVLKIQNDPELTSLDFLQTMGEIFSDDDFGLNIVDVESFGLAITKLELENCCNIIPKLNNRNIKELILNNCNVTSVAQLQLDDLVKLCLQCSQGCTCNSKLIYNMTKFNLLTQLSLIGYNGFDINPLSQMTQLNILSLQSCGLIYVDSLRHLINLKELDFSGNKNIDITPLQYILKIKINEMKQNYTTPATFNAV